MLLSFKELYKKYVMDITGIIHVGAHYGEEVEVYVNSGITNIILFEPLTANFDILEKNVSSLNANIQGYQVALGNENKIVTMHLSSNNLESSSILKPNLDSKVFGSITFDGTEEVEMKTLDDYNFQGYNFINIDVQGYELEVLKGAEKTLEKVDYVYCEVNKGVVYEGNPMIQDIDEYLSKYNLNRVETGWWGDDDWGDAFYIKNY